MASSYHIGQRMSYDGALCTIRYTGSVAGTNGEWLGVEWDDPSRGKHDGSHKGQRYFTCLCSVPTSASFVRPTRPSDPPQSFLAALHEKYVADSAPADRGPYAGMIVFGNKPAQEVGFDKVRRQMARVDDLATVIVDGMRIASATATGDQRREGEAKSIVETCPSITQLNLSRNLFEGLSSVVEICGGLAKLRNLSLDGNRFGDVLVDESLANCKEAFRGIEELALDENLHSWEETVHLASKFVSLTGLKASINQISSLPMVDYGTLASSLTTLHLEYNDFAALSDLASLVNLTSLRSLHIKGNNIAALASVGTEPPMFPPSLQYLDISYNKVDSWAFVDLLATHFPGLTGLRLAHNPVYEMRDADGKPTTSSEEAYMLTVARVGRLASLNFSKVTPADRQNAEMFYLSRIARQLAAEPEANEADILAREHPRYAELCAVYGAPDVVRRDEVNPSFLEARLVNVTFRMDGDGNPHGAETGNEKIHSLQRVSRIPKAFDVYAVKGIAGKLFGLSPLRLRLVWETGEWDPVAGFDGEDGESSDDEDEEMDGKNVDEDDAAKPGRWVRREVELRDGPRHLGYCVDGLDVTIRVERR